LKRAGFRAHTVLDFDGNSGAPISDPARFCWNLNTSRAGGRRSGAMSSCAPVFLLDGFGNSRLNGGIRHCMSEPLSKNIFWTQGKVTAEQRAHLSGHSGCVIWITGLSASGKSTIATELERELFSQGKLAYLLDGDNTRHGLCSDLGFSPEDRKENIRRLGEVARLFADAGIICISAFISPYRSDREEARRIAPPGKFIEVFVNAPLEVCERRDPKGLYARAHTGEIKEFTGVSAPYEPPVNPELELHTDKLSVAECVSAILAKLDQMSAIIDGAPAADGKKD
jgi:adenylyl-sulfate kinase